MTLFIGLSFSIVMGNDTMNPYDSGNTHFLVRSKNVAKLYCLHCVDLSVSLFGKKNWSTDVSNVILALV